MLLGILLLPLYKHNTHSHSVIAFWSGASASKTLRTLGFLCSQNFREIVSCIPSGGDKELSQSKHLTEVKRIAS